MQNVTSAPDSRPAEEDQCPIVKSASKKAQEPASLIWAYRLFWLTFLVFFASTAAGKLWDRIYHLTVTFDTFWSPLISLCL
jgi:hypothetical protein